MSGMFKLIEGELAVTVENGVYKEGALATRNNGELYVKAKGGFLRLYADGSTSGGSKCYVDALALDAPLFKDRLGKLCIAAGDGRKALDGTPDYLAIDKD